jgi:hypothetical protein
MNITEFAPSLTIRFLGIELAMLLLVLTDSTARTSSEHHAMSKNMRVAKKTSYVHQSVGYAYSYLQIPSLVCSEDQIASL